MWGMDPTPKQAVVIVIIITLALVLLVVRSLIAIFY